MRTTISPERTSLAGFTVRSTVTLALMGALAGCDGSAAPQAGESSEVGASVPSGPQDDPRIEVGRTLLSEGRPSEALMIFEAVLSKHPQLARATFYKGLVMHERKSHAAALTLYRRAAESGQAFPERDRLPYYAAWSAYYTGKPDEARTMIGQYIENVPDQADAHYLAGVLELDADNTEAAKISLQRAIELASVDLETERTMARGWVRLADVHISAGELDDALVAVNRAVELRPSLTEAWFRKYTVLMRLGDEDAAEVARERWKALSSVDNVSSGVLP